MWELIRSDTVQFFDDFWCRKKYFEKITYRGGTGTDCFEPIFGFLMQFCFEEHNSAPLGSRRDDLSTLRTLYTTKYASLLFYGPIIKTYAKAKSYN